MFAHVVNGADIGMVQRRRRTRFALKAFDGRQALREPLGQKFNGYVTPQARVLRLVDDPHASASQPPQDAIVRDRLAEDSAL
jgi:hypothetical protein